FLNLFDDFSWMSFKFVLLPELPREGPTVIIQLNVGDYYVLRDCEDWTVNAPLYDSFVTGRLAVVLIIDVTIFPKGISWTPDTGSLTSRMLRVYRGSNLRAARQR